MKSVYVLMVGELAYIGSTNDPSMRQYQHLSALRKGRHYNSKLQDAYQGQSTFLVLEVVTDELRYEAEHKWLDNYTRSGYKIANTTIVPHQKAIVIDPQPEPLVKRRKRVL
jgi:hypothetical protein